jgi:hypothetical protein
MKISVDVSPNIGGSVEIAGSTSVSYPFSRTFEENSTILVEAKPKDGYEFVNWSGDVSGNENPLEITMEYHMTIVANFSRIKHTLTVEVDGSGHTDPIAGIHSYNEGATVSLTATPDSGWQFDGWNGKVVNPDSAIAAVTMDSDKKVTANFSQTKTGIIGIIAGAIGAGLATFFATRRQKS